MKTKIWTTLIACTLIPVLAFAQPNVRLDSLERLFEASGLKIHRCQSNRRGPYITHTERVDHVWECDTNTMPRDYFMRWANTYLDISHEDWKGDPFRQCDVNEVVRRSRQTFDKLMETAQESYHFEKHSDKTDTLLYSIALSGFGGDTLRSHPYFNRPAYYENAQETVSLKFTNYNDPFWGSKTLSYNHEYRIPLPEQTEQFFRTKLDVKEFEALLKKTLKHRHVKLRPVHWKHDPSLSPNDSKDYTLLGISSHNEGYGETRGTTYYIPASEEALAYELLNKVLCLTKTYVDAHPTNDYYFTHTQGFDGCMNEILSCWLHFEGENKGRHSLLYQLYAYKDEAGYYLLSIVTDGDVLIPRRWPRLKSWVNGVRKEW